LSALILLGAAAAGKAQPLPAPLQNPDFFPVAVWWQTANETGHSGAMPTIAAAAAAAGINIMLGQGNDWPETFGADYGEFEAIKQNNLYLVGSINTPWNENTSNLSVASILALAQSIGAEANLLGYNAGDEPLCGGGNGSPTPAQVPEVVAGIESFDPTRPVWFNETAWEVENPAWIQPYPSCYQQLEAALQATNGAASFDLYPLTKAWWGPGYGTDYNAVPNDTLWMQGVAVQGLAHYAGPGQRVWVYVESGGDNFGFAEQNASFSGSVAAGSAILTSHGTPRFGSSWLKLAVSGAGIAAGTTITAIIDPTHAQMSQAATASAGSEAITVSGGVNNSDCVAKVNLCVVNGNEYRPTKAQVAAEVWASIINGATGIEYFCHDSMTYSFCLGDSAAAGAAATAAFHNLSYIDLILSHYAKVLNAPTVALCSMDAENYATGAISTSTSCSASGFSLASSNSVPGAALIKQSGTAYYVFAQSTRATAGGATYSFTLPAFANKTATVTYDSNAGYDNPNSTEGETIAVNASGSFSDAIGTHDAYQVKIYRIE
jgi:hypothetical protein